MKLSGNLEENAAVKGSDVDLSHVAMKKRSRTSLIGKKLSCFRSSDYGRPTVEEVDRDGNVDMESASADKHGSPTHLVVMVNGLIGSAKDWRFAAKQFLKKYPDDLYVHCCNFNNLSKLALVEDRLKPFLELDPIVRTFKHRIPDTSSNSSTRMSTGSQKTLCRANSNFNLDDIDCVISSIKKEGTPAPPPPRAAMTRSKSTANKRKKVAPEDELEQAERQIRECLNEQFESLRQLHAEKLKEVRDEMKTSVNSQEKALTKKIKELEFKVASACRDRDAAKSSLNAAQSKASAELEAATKNAKIWVARTVMEARIKMAKEAEDPAFDKANWEVAKWQESLTALAEQVSGGHAESATKEIVAGGGAEVEFVDDEGNDARLSPQK